MLGHLRFSKRTNQYNLRNIKAVAIGDLSPAGAMAGRVRALADARSLSARRYVYIWTDGVLLQARIEDHSKCWF